MRLTVVAIALGLVALTSGAFYPPSKPVTGVKYADKDFLYKQKFFFEVLRNIHLPLQFQEYLPYTKSYIADSSKYVNFEEVTEFFNYYKAGFLGKGELFSIYNKEYMTQTYLLFNFFYNSIDFDTFYKNVVFARENVNEGIFIHALTLAVFHHPELKGFVLPAIYEIYPYYFFNTDVIHSVTFRKQYDQKFGFASNGKYNVVYDNYTATYPIDYYGEEKLAYFTEDIGLNAYYYYFMMDYPYFLGTDKYNFSKDRRGELYLYMYQQLIARYYLERQANFLGPIEEFDYDFPLKTGYWSKLSYYNGIPFFVRNDYYSFSKDFYYQVTLLKDYEQRFRQVIDKGYYYLEDGSKIDLRQPESVEYLGNMMFSNPDSVDNYYFGFFEMIARQVYSGGAKFYKYVPSALMHFETSLRDPFFYQLYNRFLTFYYKFKSYLKPYTYEELYFKGVEIKSVAFEKLMTYFEYFDAEVSNVVPIKASGEKFFDFSVFARQKRINHKPFSYTMDVYSEFAGKGVVRVYMGPKFYDFKELQYVKKYFVEVDQYQYDFVTGKNTIVRNSRDFYYSVRDRTTYTELYKKIMTAYSGGEKFVLDNSEAHCGFPDRLLLPKGLPSGYEMTFYFIVTPYYAPKVPQFSTYDNTYQCGVGSGSKYIDDLPFGYPFDRDIDFSYFYTKNMYFKDVFIYHSEEIKPYVPYHAVEDTPYVPYQV